MKPALVPIILLSLSTLLQAQEKSLKSLLSDSTMRHGSISFCILDGGCGKTVFEYNPDKSLIPASIMKLLTSAAALELLGPDHTFKTKIGYSGSLVKGSGLLDGDIIITGGGDPTLGSSRFPAYYNDFISGWIKEIKNARIRKVTGRVISDDSYFDYMPVPAKWLWEDAGNYYGAGAYGLSVYDNTYEIHFKTSADSTRQVITGISPPECSFQFMNWMVAAGTSDEGYVFAAPYSTNGWLSGSLPASPDDYILKASIADPPMIMARILDQKLKESGIKIKGSPTTVRLMQKGVSGKVTQIAEVSSPPLKEIIASLNHESVNLYAEHLVKELGREMLQSGTTASGIEVVRQFLAGAGINTGGLFIEDGSGLSPLDAIDAGSMTQLLFYMKSKSKNFKVFLESLPAAGNEGSLKNNFKNPAFEGRLYAKSGSMTRVRSYAGYLKAASGKDLIFCIIVNNFEGSSSEIITRIEEILKETILNN
jgi:serine-type D-Ala-D-Ala carboxypeptidase/endopeptidase (penicillin-binding protein 4)